MSQILIIEDERAILSLLQRIVTHMGHTALAASNGTAAVALLEEIEPDLVVSDLKMPGTPSGIDLIRAIREKFAKLPIIVISGYASRDFMSKWPELGIDEFLPKPFDMYAIRNVIERVLHRTPVAGG